MKPAYICEYCGKIGQYKEISEHEKSCEYNPDVMACFTCAYCSIQPYSVNNQLMYECKLNIPVQKNGEHCTHYFHGKPTRIIPV